MVAISFVLAALSLAVAAFAAPVRRDFSPLPLVSRTTSTVGGKDYGLDGNLVNFDDFFGKHMLDRLLPNPSWHSSKGSNNFHGRSHKKVIIKQEEKLVRRRVTVTVVQQQITVIRELLKRIITRQICNVELQTVCVAVGTWIMHACVHLWDFCSVIQQFRSHMKSFHQGIRRSGTHDSASYDERIANMYNQLIGPNGDLSDKDMDFGGNDVGKNSRSVGGDNYNANTSPAKISAIFKGSLDLAKAQDKTGVNFN
jgi:hypothetical protein